MASTYLLQQCMLYAVPVLENGMHTFDLLEVIKSLKPLKFSSKVLDSS